MIFEPKKRRTPIYRELRGTRTQNPEVQDLTNPPTDRGRERVRGRERRALDLIDELLEQE